MYGDIYGLGILHILWGYGSPYSCVNRIFFLPRVMWAKTRYCGYLKVDPNGF